MNTPKEKSSQSTSKKPSTSASKTPAHGSAWVKPALHWMAEHFPQATIKAMQTLSHLLPGLPESPQPKKSDSKSQRVNSTESTQPSTEPLPKQATKRKRPKTKTK